MIANSAFLAGLVLLVAIFTSLAQLEFLVPYKRLIIERYLWTLLGVVAVMYVNLFGLFYAISRRLFLKDTGRKLAHVERQLRTSDSIVADLSERLSEER